MFTFSDKRKDIPDGLWAKCDECGEIVYSGELSRNLGICSKCNYHFPLEPADRIAILADEESLVRSNVDGQHVTCPDEEICERMIITGEAELSGHQLVIAAVNIGSTGRDIGLFVCEGIVRAVNQAIDQRLPLLMIYTSSNGAQDSALFPAQTLSISAALSRLDKEKLLYISVLAYSNSNSHFPGFACVADVVVAESNIPAARTNNQIDQAEAAQAVQTLFQNGMADMIVSRKDLKHTLTDVLSFFC
ncbi:hypothetical protein ACFL6S_15195 [Candidatus Poribacteria bacterium]